MLKFELDLPDLEDLKANALPLALGDATKQAGATWIREELPKRFAVGAALRFGWKPRTKGYALRKGKRRGHQKDMVWTGNMQRMVLSTARTTFNRRSLRTTITFAVPEYADIRRQSARGTTIRSEISKLILADTAAIQQEVARLLPEMLVNNPKYRVKRKRKKL